MIDDTDIDSEIRTAQLLSGFGSVPPLDPPSDWKQVECVVQEEFALRNALSGLPEESEQYRLISGRLAAFLDSDPFEDLDDPELLGGDSALDGTDSAVSGENLGQPRTLSPARSRGPNADDEEHHLTVLDDLSTDDQIILMRVPTAVVMATAYSEQDGVLSVRKELKAGLQAAIDGATAFPSNQIIQRLSLEMNSIDHQEVDEVKDKAKHATAPEDLVEERNPTNSRPLALQLAAQSLAVMETSASAEEAVEFKYWLYSIADQVTLASKAGGFLGFGGTRVSAAEAAFLTELRQALDIPDDNVSSAAESNAKYDDDDDTTSEAVDTSEPVLSEEDEAARIAAMDAASVRDDEPVLEVPAERPEDV